MAEQTKSALKRLPNCTERCSSSRCEQSPKFSENVNELWSQQHVLWESQAMPRANDRVVPSDGSKKRKSNASSIDRDENLIVKRHTGPAKLVDYFVPSPTNLVQARQTIHNDRTFESRLRAERDMNVARAAQPQSQAVAKLVDYSVPLPTNLVQARQTIPDDDRTFKSRLHAERVMNAARASQPPRQAAAKLVDYSVPLPTNLVQARQTIPNDDRTSESRLHAKPDMNLARASQPPRQAAAKLADYSVPLPANLVQARRTIPDDDRTSESRLHAERDMNVARASQPPRQAAAKLADYSVPLPTNLVQARQTVPDDDRTSESRLHAERVMNVARASQPPRQTAAKVIDCQVIDLTQSDDDAPQPPHPTISSGQVASDQELQELVKSTQADRACSSACSHHAPAGSESSAFTLPISEIEATTVQKERRIEAPPLSYDTAEQVHSLCSCHKPIGDLHSAVTCAGPECKIGIFHRLCVGLGSRAVPQGWRCWQCRPKAPTGLLSSRPAQLLPSQTNIQQPPSSQSAMTTLPISTPIPALRHESEPDLHPEQAKVVDCILQGINVFYTGSAGTGKSTVLKSFVKKLKEFGKHVDIVAPSGIAALNVGGMTIYAYAGWHPDSFKESLQEFVRKSHGKNVRRRLCKTDVLVIDEISMVERDILVRLNTMMQEVRAGWKPEKGEKAMSRHSRKLPFGGAQIIVTGDFCQLPPVKPFKFCMDCGGDELPGHATQDGRPLTCRRCRKVYEDRDKWAFCSKTWKACKFTCFELRHIHRQSDKRFIDILQRCRYGQPLLPADKAALLASKPDPLGAVRLLPRRDEVNAVNSRNFNSLKSAAYAYDCLDCFMWRNKDEPDLQRKGVPKYRDRPDGPLNALQDHRFEERVHLKEGMLVILLVNLDFNTGLVNGSQGKIIGFEKHEEQRVFEPQAQTKPNVPRLSGHGGQEPSQKSELAIIKEAQIRHFVNRNSVRWWPVVKFQNGLVKPIYAQCQMSELGSEKPYSLLGRTQIPLLAAWAITVHKSQGMTLNNVIVDLHSSFEKEMVYVALSRARSLEGLKVERLAMNMDRGINEEVHKFLREHGLGGCR